MEIFISIIVGLFSLIAGFVSGYIYLRPRLRQFQELDKKTQQVNEQLRITNTKLNDEYTSLLDRKNLVSNQINELNISLQTLEKQSKDAADLFYEKNMALASQNFEQSIENERQKYLETIALYNQELEQIKTEGAQSFIDSINAQKEELNKLNQQFAKLKNNTDIAVAAAKRTEEIKEQTNFYKIQLSETDLEEIRMLKDISSHMRDQEPLNKVIWKVYYEKPTTDLIGRVIGSGIHTGIYKITNLDNNKCYVGQAVNLGDRWKQHIKRGLGAETPTRNKLYPAMMAIGVEKFSFEVIEECERSELDEREDYWQEYFHAKEYGYSIK